MLTFNNIMKYFVGCRKSQAGLRFQFSSINFQRKRGASGTTDANHGAIANKTRVLPSPHGSRRAQVNQQPTTPFRSADPQVSAGSCCGFFVEGGVRTSWIDVQSGQFQVKSFSQGVSVVKRLIDKLVYDTDTAERIWHWDNGRDNRDFHQCDETLCKTPNGRWFLWGCGGAASRWSSQHGDNFGAGEGLCALSPDEALEWLETHDADAAIVERHFKVEKA